MHPVEAANYVIPTPAMECWINGVCAHCQGNAPGAITPGRQRIGKSYAIRYFVENQFKYLGDSVAVVSMEVAPHRSITEKMLFGDLLRSMGYPTTKSDPEARRSLFIGRLVEAASRAIHRKVLIIIDEAQLLDSFTLRLLASVHNDLVRIYKVTCMWLLVGQDELSILRQTVLAEGQRQLVARFMRETIELGRLQAGAEFRYCVSCYDKMRYPAKDGPTFSEYFAPEACKAGYQIGSDADLILETLQTEAHQHGIASMDAISMEAFTAVMNDILVNQLPRLDVGDRLDLGMILESAEAVAWLSLEEDAFLADVEAVDGTNKNAA